MRMAVVTTDGPTPQGGNSADWRIQRVGAAFPDGNVTLRRDAAADVVSSFGIPASLYSGSEGASVREGFRQWGVSMDAYTEIVAEELSNKLERAISISNRRLAVNRHRGPGSCTGDFHSDPGWHFRRPWSSPDWRAKCLH